MTGRGHAHVGEMTVVLAKRTATGAHYVAIRIDGHDDAIAMTGDEARALAHSLLEAADDYGRAMAGLPLLGGVDVAGRLS